MNNSPNSRRAYAILIIKGILYSNLFAIVSFAIAYLVTNWNEGLGSILSFSEFVLVPMAMGIIAMRFWMRLSARLLPLLPYALLNTIVGIGICAFFMQEGIICIIIVSPLILAFMWIGVLIGKYILKRDNSTLQASSPDLFDSICVRHLFRTQLPECRNR